MSVIIGAVLGLIGFAAVLVLGSIHQVAFSWSLLRGVVAFAVGFLLGWLLFGPLGISLVRESAGHLSGPPAPRREGEEPGEGEESKDQEEEGKAPKEGVPPETEAGR